MPSLFSTTMQADILNFITIKRPRLELEDEDLENQNLNRASNIVQIATVPQDPSLSPKIQNELVNLGPHQPMNHEF